MRKTYTITGKVQGVYFRKFTLKKAHELELKGFVKNQRDGTVYCEAIGSENQHSEFFKFLSEGSPSARVEKVIVEDSKNQENHNSFVIR